MGQVLHGSARTTAAVGRAIQQSQASLKTLAEQYDINPKTVAKWKQRRCVQDAPMGPKQPRSGVLTAEQEGACVAFRKLTLLPLDDCLYALPESILGLTRSSLHHCFQRHGISRLPELTGDKPPQKKFKAYPIGFFHLDIAELCTEEGKLYLFVAIDRTSKFAYVELLTRAGNLEAAQFLHNLVAAVPYPIQIVLTDNGIQFTNRTRESSRWPCGSRSKGESWTGFAPPLTFTLALFNVLIDWDGIHAERDGSIHLSIAQFSL